jgi:hypothetical protein
VIQLTEFLLGAGPPGLRKEGKQGQPSENGDGRSDEVEIAPAKVSDDDWRADTQADNDKTLE